MADKERRPGDQTEAPDVRWLAVKTSLPRCLDCGRLIYAQESLASGLGRDCRRRAVA